MRTSLDGLHDGRSVSMASKEDDRQRHAEFAQPRLQGRTVQAGHMHVENEATRFVAGRQVV